MDICVWFIMSMLTAVDNGVAPVYGPSLSIVICGHRVARQDP